MSLVSAFVVVVFALVQGISPADSQSRTDGSDSQLSPFAGVPGVPGSPGRNGAPGRDGRDGIKGEKGIKGESGGRGHAGISGIRGPSGSNGERGLRGEAGEKGNAGKIGPQGPQGSGGGEGRKGDKGGKGEVGEVEKLNWKQCVWDREDGKDTGLIQNCGFTKFNNNSALHVAFAGNLRVSCGSGSCCSRWYFTFNSKECRGPMTIEGVLYGNPASNNELRHRQIEGYCENIPAGHVTVGFNVGNCRSTSQTYDAHTGWKSVSRSMIQEVPPPQQ